MRRIRISLILIAGLFFLVSSTQFSQASVCANMKREPVWHISGASVNIGEKPWFSFVYTKIYCCVPGTDMELCNKSLEDTTCAQIVVRPPCMPFTE
jgi:hypothetical protein